MTNSEAIAVLAQVRAAVGRSYKQAIRKAWMDGDYRSASLAQWSAQLQRIRNTLGPTWLHNARPK